MRRPKQPEVEIKVTGHILVPKHEILPAEEKQNILHKYNASAAQFPYILGSDPVIKEIGAKPGDLIKITRVSETAGQTAYYRLVVEG